MGRLLRFRGRQSTFQPEVMPSLKKLEFVSRPRLREKDLGVRRWKDTLAISVCFSLRLSGYGARARAPRPLHVGRRPLTDVRSRWSAIQGRRVGEWHGQHRSAQGPYVTQLHSCSRLRRSPGRARRWTERRIAGVHRPGGHRPHEHRSAPHLERKHAPGSSNRQDTTL